MRKTPLEIFCMEMDWFFFEIEVKEEMAKDPFWQKGDMQLMSEGIMGRQLDSAREFGQTHRRKK